MDRKSMLETFQERLAEVVRASGLNQSEFAASALIDRSTLSQLLLHTNRRFPRAETLAAIANRHQVSIDWLLGLSHAGPMQAEMMQEQTSFALDALAANDQRLLDWFADADGYKIRYVPSTLPDLLKTETVIRHELDHYVASRPEQKIETASVRLARTREPGSDMECCSSLQSLQGFAHGDGIWRALAPSARREQLQQIIDLSDELYPMFRWFLFDLLQRYAAPITIFGPKRAALYLGQMYLVLTSAEHVRTFTGHFDNLIRGAVVQPPDIGRTARALLTEIS